MVEFLLLSQGYHQIFQLARGKSAKKYFRGMVKKTRAGVRKSNGGNLIFACNCVQSHVQSGKKAGGQFVQPAFVRKMRKIAGDLRTCIVRVL